MAAILWDATLIGPESSGTATRLAGLMKAYLDVFGGGDLVLVHRPDWTPPESWRHAGLHLVPCGMPRAPLLRALVAGHRLGLLAGRLGARVVQTEILPPPVLGRARVLATVHDLRFLDPDISGWPRRLVGGRAVLARLRRAWRVITVSEAMAERLRVAANLDPDSLVVVPNGVDPGLMGLPSLVPSREKAPSWSPGEEKRLVPGRQDVLVLGHLERRKDPMTALRGFASWPDRPPGARLFIAGADRGGLAAGLRGEAALLGLSNRVCLCGSIDDGARARWLVRAGVVLVPSRHEGFGMVGLEAQAAGTPVVASSIAAHREVLADGALYFEPGNPRALGLCLRVLSRRRDRLVRQGLENARRWRWKEAALRLRALHEEALEQ